MISVDSITIKEMRGIRDLTLEFDGKSFVVSGSNGTGKSGVVDAIEFGLTGRISRLEGAGTGPTSLKSHGPHISQREKPEFSEVTLNLTLLDSGDKVTMTRNMKTSAAYFISPDTNEIRATLDEVAEHPELVLSRREIIKFIIARPGERSGRVQLLLKLDGIDESRRLLKSTENKLGTEFDAAKTECENKKRDLDRHLQIDSDVSSEFLKSVNNSRRILGLEDISIIQLRTPFLDGEVDAGPVAIDKASTLRDIDDVIKALPTIIKDGNADCRTILQELVVVGEDDEFLDLLNKSDLVTAGLDLVDSPTCPLCGYVWPDLESLKSHLEDQISLAKDAIELRDRILVVGVKVTKAARLLKSKVGVLEAASKMVTPSDEFSKLTDWQQALDTFATSCELIDEILNLKSTFETDWSQTPDGLTEILDKLKKAAEALPEPSDSKAATTFLAVAQERFASYDQSKRTAALLQTASERSSVAYIEYCAAAENYLENLYRSVESDFSTYYRILNGDDESQFKAEFRQDGGKLNLDVDFYGFGMFPPHAYHSEGHQDGMGVCLYLALMKQVMPDHFRFSVLDDVVMSIDVGHRKRFCHLLATEFPQTQFIITTHDRVWAKQMRTSGLVGPRAGVEFTSWSVETGPIFEEIDDVWTKIAIDLASSDVNSAGARLRHYLEYICSELADNLGASVKYRIDSDYDFGDLWYGVTGRYTKLLGLAMKSAAAWGRTDQESATNIRKDAWSKANTRYGEEGWVVNKVVHFNDWATFTVKEFEDVIDSVRTVLAELRCDRPECNSWIYVMPLRGNPDELRCRCGTTSLNLRVK